MTIFEKLFKGNPDRDRLYANRANPLKQERLAQRAANRESAAQKEPERNNQPK